jgi:2-hydroxychromene-2-carboxylate isomerase
MSAQVDFYFDYLSPYAYFASLRIVEVCQRRGVHLGIQPVLFAALLDHWGQKGPAEIAPKRLFVFKDAVRYAALNGVELAFPRHHPFNPLTALRLSLPEVAGADQARVVSTIFEAGWARGIDLGSRNELQAALDRAGLEGGRLLARTDEPAVKELLRNRTSAAVQRGVFGIPTMVARGFDPEQPSAEELFWGNDAVAHLERCLDGTDPLATSPLREVLLRPPTATAIRPRSQ